MIVSGLCWRSSVFDTPTHVPMLFSDPPGNLSPLVGSRRCSGGGGNGASVVVVVGEESLLFRHFRLFAAKTSYRFGAVFEEIVTRVSYDRPRINIHTRRYIIRVHAPSSSEYFMQVPLGVSIRRATAPPARLRFSETSSFSSTHVCVRF